MKKSLLIAALALISAVTFAQAKKDTAKASHSKKEVKKSKVPAPVTTVAPVDSVKVSAAELKVIIGKFFDLVDDSSDISRKASKPILQALHDFYAKTFPEKPSVSPVLPVQPTKPTEIK